MTESLEGPIWWPAPAKLNLFLHVVGQRPDGYHCLQTVFQIIDLCDWINLSVRSDGEICHLNPLSGVPQELDLTVRAARLLQQHANCRQGVDISIQKKIPMGAGLGGGSSDAATVLVVLNRLWGVDLDKVELAKLAAKLGADVPVFVFGRNAWAEGIGDILTPVDLEPSWYAIFVPDIHIDTSHVFAAEDLTRDSNPITISGFLGGYRENTLERVVFSRYSGVRQVVEWLRARGIKGSMSGSGSAVFATLSSEEEACRLVEECPLDCRCFVSAGCEMSPLMKRLPQD